MLYHSFTLVKCDLTWQKLEIRPPIVTRSSRCPHLTWACFPGSPLSGTTQKSSSRGRHVLPSSQKRSRPVPRIRRAWPWKTMNGLRRRSIQLWCEGRGRLTRSAGETRTRMQIHILLVLVSVCQCRACNYVIENCVHCQHVPIKFPRTHFGNWLMMCARMQQQQQHTTLQHLHSCCGI